MIKSMHHFLYSFPKNVIRCFSPRNLIWHLVAICLTALIVLSGFDWFYYISTRNESLNVVLFPAVIIGGIMPLIIPLTLLLLGRLFNNKQLTHTGWAIGQAILIAILIAATYKAFTGRVQPELWNVTTDVSRNFNFGFWRHGVFWGWPSSHTTVAFAMAVTVIRLFPKNKLLTLLALIYAFYIGFGISLSIHWFSEFVAGAVFGSIIGTVVGKNVRHDKLQK